MTMININLLPWREELKEEKKKEFLFILGIVVAAALAIVVFIHFYIDRQIKFQNEDNAYLRSEIKILEKQLEEIKIIGKEKKQLLQKMKVIQALQASRPEVVRLFDGIVRIVSQGLYITNLSRTGDIIRIDGKAESNTRVSGLMRNIEASNLLKDPKLSFIQAEDNKQDKSQNKTQDTNQQDRFIGFHLDATQVTQSTLSSPTDEKNTESK